MLRQHFNKNKSRVLRSNGKAAKTRKSSLRSAATHLGVSPGHLSRVLNGERPNVGQLKERALRLMKGAR